jgi:hypothetical protein
MDSIIDGMARGASSVSTTHPGMASLLAHMLDESDDPA